MWCSSSEIIDQRGRGRGSPARRTQTVSRKGNMLVSDLRFYLERVLSRCTFAHDTPLDFETSMISYKYHSRCVCVPLTDGSVSRPFDFARRPAGSIKRRRLRDVHSILGIFAPLALLACSSVRFLSFPLSLLLGAPWLSLLLR